MLDYIEFVVKHAESWSFYLLVVLYVRHQISQVFYHMSIDILQFELNRDQMLGCIFGEEESFTAVDRKVILFCQVQQNRIVLCDVAARDKEIDILANDFSLIVFEERRESIVG